MSLTVEAVKAFQVAHSIQGTGYFGPLTQAAANNEVQILTTITPSPASYIEAKTITTESNGAAVFLSSAKKITWQTIGYPKNVGVNIVLIRKTSETPTTYSIVRIIAQDTPNDGVETWIPALNENTNDLYVEVTCSNTHTFVDGCSMGGKPIKLQ